MPESPPPSAVPVVGIASDAPVAASESVETGASQPLPEAAGRAADPGLSSAPAVSARESTGLRLRVPALAIDTQIVTLGFGADGQLEVPSDGSSAGWYDISPRPGDAGNALIGAHFDWDGSLAVFARLNELSPGDQIVLSDGSEELVYEVSQAAAIGSDYPLADVLASDAAGSSLTLFTCGGSFDVASSEYDERFLVRAVAVGISAPLTAHR